MSTCSTASNNPAAKQHSPAVVYLDFDGVLHHHNVLWSAKRGPHLDASAQDVLFQHAELLLGLLRPYPDIRIVLSTSWVLKYGCYGAARRLPAELQDRVIGATFHTKMDRTTFEDAFRGMQVWGMCTAAALATGLLLMMTTSNGLCGVVKTWLGPIQKKASMSPKRLMRYDWA